MVKFIKEILFCRAMSLKNILNGIDMSTDTWRTIEIVDAPASNVVINPVERPFEEPKEKSINACG